MSGISSWIMSVCGVCVLGVVVDLILPNGQTKKYIKGIFAFVVVLIVVSPLPNLLNKEFSIDDIFNEDEIVIQDNFIFLTNQNKLESIENMIESDLEEQGIKHVKVVLSANIFLEKLEIDAVFVDLSNVVINEKTEHINVNELVIESVLKYVLIEEEKIIFD